MRTIETVFAVGEIAAHLSGRPGIGIVADEEALPFREGSLDLVVSGLSLQFVNDLPGTLVQIRRALKPDGLFLAALVGGETLTELRQAFAAAEAEVEGGISPRVAPFAVFSGWSRGVSPPRPAPCRHPAAPGRRRGGPPRRPAAPR